jgi:hypothetical protein
MKLVARKPLRRPTEAKERSVGSEFGYLGVLFVGQLSAFSSSPNPRPCSLAGRARSAPFLGRKLSLRRSAQAVASPPVSLASGGGSPRGVGSRGGLVPGCALVLALSEFPRGRCRARTDDLLVVSQLLFLLS